VLNAASFPTGSGGSRALRYFDISGQTLTTKKIPKKNRLPACAWSGVWQPLEQLAACLPKPPTSVALGVPESSRALLRPDAGSGPFEPARPGCGCEPFHHTCFLRCEVFFCARPKTAIWGSA